jgi:hypothetical protein
MSLLGALKFGRKGLLYMTWNGQTSPLEEYNSRTGAGGKDISPRRRTIRTGRGVKIRNQNGNVMKSVLKIKDSQIKCLVTTCCQIQT